MSVVQLVPMWRLTDRMVRPDIGFGVDRSLPTCFWCSRNSAVTRVQTVCDPKVICTGIAVSITVEAREWFDTADFGSLTEHIELIHPQGWRDLLTSPRFSPDATFAQPWFVD